MGDRYKQVQGKPHFSFFLPYPDRWHHLYGNFKFLPNPDRWHHAYGVELQVLHFLQFASCFAWPGLVINWAALLQLASQSKWLAGICRLLRSNHSCIDGRRKLTQASMCLVCLHSGADEAHARSGFDSASYVLSDRKQTGHSLVFRFLSGLVPLFVGWKGGEGGGGRSSLEAAAQSPRFGCYM